jgi:hypothetical protein
VTLRSCVLRQKSGVVPAWLVEACLETAVSTISEAYEGVTGGSVAQPKCQKSLFFMDLCRLECASSNQGVRGSNPFGRTFYQKKLFGSPGHEIGNEQIEPLTDNKTVRLPGAAPGWTSPLQRGRSGAKRRTSGAAASTAPQRR